jgi:hypothetical protein
VSEGEAFNKAVPTEIPIFDSQNKITTHWITIETEYGCDQ